MLSNKKDISPTIQVYRLNDNLPPTYNPFVKPEHTRNLQEYRSTESEEKNLTFMTNLNSYLAQYCEVAGMHGIRYVGERGRFIFEKLFWSMVVIGFWGICIFLISKTYEKWDKNPVVVTFATKETPIWTIPFPAITICPESKANVSQYNYTYLLDKLNRSGLTDNERKMFETFSLVCETAKFFNINHTDTWPEFVPDETIERIVEFALPVFRPWLVKWTTEELTDVDVSKLTITSQGLCYTFNGLPIQNILRNPEQYMLRNDTQIVTNWDNVAGYITDDNDADNYPRTMFLTGVTSGFLGLLTTQKSFMDSSCGFSHGYKVMLHHPAELPSVDRHVYVPVDAMINIAIKPKLIRVAESLKNHPPEKRNCYFFKERYLKHFYQYTQNNCISECISNHSENICSCIPFDMPKSPDTPICGLKQGACLLIAQEQFSKNIFDKCHCLPSCTTLQYDTEISQSDWDWGLVGKVLKTMYPSIVKKDFWEVSPDKHASYIAVYYNEMQFLSSERRELFGIIDFISNTGGLIGLFVGFSITSFVEIIYFFTLRIVCNIIKYGKRSWAGEITKTN